MPESSSKQSPKPASPKTADQPRGRASVYTHRNRTVNVPDGYLAVGYVGGVHGLKGELRVELYTDFPERFAPGIALYAGDDLRGITVLGARPHKGQILLTLENVASREAAEAWRGVWLFVKEDEAVKLDADVYWVHDIIGLEVETTDGQRLGVISDVLFTGANEVYVVQPLPTVNNGRELLLPAIAEVVQAVNLAANLMVVQLLPGLLEDEQDSTLLAK
jgi:16S rRNA processing protein RimM